MPARPTASITSWIPERNEPPGWASLALAKVEPPNETTFDAKVFRVALIALARDLDYLWPLVIRHWSSDRTLIEGLADLLRRTIEAYEREGRLPDRRWAKAARARAAAWRAALVVFAAAVDLDLAGAPWGREREALAAAAAAELAAAELAAVETLAPEIAPLELAL
jgi:hypothetical protein